MNAGIAASSCYGDVYKSKLDYLHVFGEFAHACCDGGIGRLHSHT